MKRYAQTTNSSKKQWELRTKSSETGSMLYTTEYSDYLDYDYDYDYDNLEYDYTSDNSDNYNEANSSSSELPSIHYDTEIFELSKSKINSQATAKNIIEMPIFRFESENFPNSNRSKKSSVTSSSKPLQQFRAHGRKAKHVKPPVLSDKTRTLTTISEVEVSLPINKPQLPPPPEIIDEETSPSKRKGKSHRKHVPAPKFEEKLPKVPREVENKPLDPLQQAAEEYLKMALKEKAKQEKKQKPLKIKPAAGSKAAIYKKNEIIFSDSEDKRTKSMDSEKQQRKRIVERISSQQSRSEDDLKTDNSFEFTPKSTDKSTIEKNKEITKSDESDIDFKPDPIKFELPQPLESATSTYASTVDQNTGPEIIHREMPPEFITKQSKPEKVTSEGDPTSLSTSKIQHEPTADSTAAITTATSTTTRTRTRPTLSVSTPMNEVKVEETQNEQPQEQKPDVPTRRTATSTSAESHFNKLDLQNNEAVLRLMMDSTTTEDSFFRETGEDFSQPKEGEKPKEDRQLVAVGEDLLEDISVFEDAGDMVPTESIAPLPSTATSTIDRPSPVKTPASFSDLPDTAHMVQGAELEVIYADGLESDGGAEEEDFGVEPAVDDGKSAVVGLVQELNPAKKIAPTVVQPLELVRPKPQPQRPPPKIPIVFEEPPALSTTVTTTITAPHSQTSTSRFSSRAQEADDTDTIDSQEKAVRQRARTRTASVAEEEKPKGGRRQRTRQRATIRTETETETEKEASESEEEREMKLNEILSSMQGRANKANSEREEKERKEEERRRLERLEAAAAEERFRLRMEAPLRPPDEARAILALPSETTTESARREETQTQSESDVQMFGRFALPDTRNSTSEAEATGESVRRRIRQRIRNPEIHQTNDNNQKMPEPVATIAPTQTSEGAASWFKCEAYRDTIPTRQKDQLGINIEELTKSPYDNIQNPISGWLRFQTDILPDSVDDSIIEKRAIKQYDFSRLIAEMRSS